ncbi:MAG TPA: hypothetical protein VEY12_11105 [Thermoplasmata archaeon]|nr:hypothetical protein [Thermoplasmata archaeon]
MGQQRYRIKLQDGTVTFADVPTIKDTVPMPRAWIITLQDGTRLPVDRLPPGFKHPKVWRVTTVSDEEGGGYILDDGRGPTREVTAIYVCPICGDPVVERGRPIPAIPAWEDLKPPGPEDPAWKWFRYIGAVGGGKYCAKHAPESEREREERNLIDQLRRRDAERLHKGTEFASRRQGHHNDGGEYKESFDSDESRDPWELPDAGDEWVHKCPAKAGAIVWLPDETEECPYCGAWA